MQPSDHTTPAAPSALPSKFRGSHQDLDPSDPGYAGVSGGAGGYESEDYTSDEGFDESWADEFPLYSRPSGVRKFSGDDLRRAGALRDDDDERDGDDEEDDEDERTAYSFRSRAGLHAHASYARKEDEEEQARPPLPPPPSFKEVMERVAAASGKQAGAGSQPAQGDYSQLDPGTQRNQDSVLHYFFATRESEEVLDQYLTGIIQAFLEQPSTINANTSEDPATTRARFSTSIVPDSGDFGMNLERYLLTVKANVIDKATRVSSPKMIGHMTSALPYFHRPLARLLTALNQNVVKLETASTMTYLERETVAMLHREFYGQSTTFYDHHAHSPDHSLGVFTSGGTIANVTALWTARNKALRAEPAKGFRGVERVGLVAALKHYGYAGAVIVGSALLHYSFKKAADLLGLGDEGLCTIPADNDFKMRVDLLEKKVEELKSKNMLIVAIVGVVGTTETGSIDDLASIGRIAQRHQIHFHADAAWGGPLIFSREHRRKLSGIHLADTITIDGHKQLYTPMGLGLLLLRSPTDASHIRKTANYVIRHDSPDLGKYTLEGSRPANSLHLHATLHLLGRDGIESLVTRSATLVRQLASRLRSHPSGAFQVLHEPETNILLYRIVPVALRCKVAALAPLEPSEDDRIGELTRRVQARQAREGVKGFVSRTTVVREGRGIEAFRVVIANPLTRWGDVEGVVGEQVSIGETVEEEMALERKGEVQEKVTMWAGWPFDM
ncbi:hypothetical protein HK101_001802 [Irineochytrium annulatum]|nr:hypothetical protein HK101_001802 [Irineochytrium annulatum]